MATYSAKNNGYTATLTLTPGTQSVENNTTEVAYKLTLTAGSNYFDLWPIGWEIWLAGSRTSYQALRGAPQKSISAGGTITLVSGKVTIPHNTDGTMIVSIAFRVDGGDDASYLPGTIRFQVGTDTLVLPTIPRASQLSLSTDSVTLNGSAGSIKITVSAHSSSFSHKVKYTFGSASGEISLNAGATTGTLSLPMSLLNQIPNNTSGPATVTLTTYNGSTAIGTASAQFTIAAGANVVPSISAFTATRVGQSALDMYIKGYDRARLRTTAAGAYGSTIRTYEVSGGLSGADVTTGILWTTGSNSWTIKVTDSRGRTASKSVSVTVVDYYTPVVSGASFERCTANGTPDDDGTYLQVSANISIASCDGKNSYSAKVQYKLQSSDYWTDAGALTGASQLYDLSLSDDAYDVRIAVMDKLSTGYASATLDVGDVLFDYDPSSHVLEFMPSITAKGNMQIGGDGKQHAILIPGGDHNTFIYGGQADDDTALGVWDGRNGRYVALYQDADKRLVFGPDLIDIGGNGWEHRLRFISSDNSAKPHNAGIYGGNGEDNVAFGIFDWINSRLVVAYDDVNNTLRLGTSSTKVSINDNLVTESIVEKQETTQSGKWNYRKYSDGSCDLWAYLKISGLNATTQMGSWYSATAPNLADYPFSLTQWLPTASFVPGDAGLSVIPWAIVDGTATNPPRYWLIGPNSQAGVNGKLVIFVHGRWR